MKLFFKTCAYSLFCLALPTSGFSNTNDNVFLKLADNSGLSETNVLFDFNADGIVDYRRQEIFRGSNLILTTFWQKGVGVSHAFHIGNDIVLVEDDNDGDGLFENITLMGGTRLIESFRRSSDGKVHPVPTESLEAMQKSVVMAEQLMSSIVHAVTNNTPEKVEEVIIDEVEKIKNKGKGKEKDKGQASKNGTK